MKKTEDIQRTKEFTEVKNVTTKLKEGMKDRESNFPRQQNIKKET